MVSKDSCNLENNLHSTVWFIISCILSQHAHEVRKPAIISIYGRDNRIAGSSVT